MALDPNSRVPDLETLVRQLQGERWHVVGAAGEPAFAGAWANVGGAYEVLAFRFVNPMMVALKGTVAAGNMGTTVFTLPLAYRPALARRIGIGIFDGGAHFPGKVLVTAAGLVQVYATGPVDPVDEACLEVVFAL